jgi:formylglycine-generating enzyme required for sulfatase activity
MVLIPGGTFRMGSDKGMPHEAPIHAVRLDSFYVDAHEVTNAEFARFVDAAGYVTEAEKWGWSLVFDPREDDAARVPEAPWWRKEDAADWRHPDGPSASIDGKDNYPVVQVSWNDAAAYAAWAGKRLPTEAEWEYAGRGGLAGSEFPWGNEFEHGGHAMMNTWSGVFPEHDEGTDGYTGLAPVGSFPANGYGLYDMAGNVWEWCADWYGVNYYDRSPSVNPRGPEAGVERVLRGGSWLCADNYCVGFRVSHRNKSAADSGLTNTGFRCAKGAP